MREFEVFIDEICDCGKPKKIQDQYCNKCQKEIIENFRAVIQKNFEKAEVEYLDEILDGEWIEDFVFGKEVS